MFCICSSIVLFHDRYSYSSSSSEFFRHKFINKKKRPGSGHLVSSLIKTVWVWSEIIEACARSFGPAVRGSLCMVVTFAMVDLGGSTKVNSPPPAAQVSEVLCGRLAMIGIYEDERRFLSYLVKLHQEKGTLHEIIMSNLLEQMDPYALQVFSNIALQCLNEDRKQRPTMSLIVKDLEISLKYQGTRTQLWGTERAGGWPFLFKLEGNQKLRKITICHGLGIHSLMFTAEDSDGLLRSSEQYSGLIYDPNIDEMFVIDFDADEEMIGISGTFRIANFALISSLSFETNKKKHGPYGKVGTQDTHFSGSWDLGLFDGFYGHYGFYVDAIGCYLKTNI
ncbi:hypothetical protein L1987_35136 [Smallanthus sonchifolius]|uniref:Uncharacterized protein n=1 Tax=Smallanthus sonchifolius TaxID=185202 RepID=A0ACB9HW94_9ASTR|nr:hypothetical protein L1987_35136 [Smallanthus sonchifolius]